jgi:hypothetical protein
MISEIMFVRLVQLFHSALLTIREDQDRNNDSGEAFRPVKDSTRNDKIQYLTLCPRMKVESKTFGNASAHSLSLIDSACIQLTEIRPVRTIY